MDWIKQMNQAIEYIESQLEYEIDYKKVAQVAQCSEYHFQRMFSYIFDVPLSEYVRRRRLSKAAIELKNSDIKVIDLAIKYGYESPDSFSKAFSRLHGVTPSMAKNVKTVIKAYPKISLLMQIKGGIEMNYRIEVKDEFKVFGVTKEINHEDDVYTLIPAFWQQIQEDGTYQRICRAMNEEPYKGVSLSGAFYDFPIENGLKRLYLIYAPVDENVTDLDRFEVFTIPKSQWVVFQESFDHVEESTEKIQSIWKRVYTEWFPSFEYEFIPGLSMEVFPPNTSTCEVWIPIKEKK